MSKKIVWFFIVMLITSIMIGDKAAFASVVDGDVVVEAYSVNKTSIYPGDVFKLTIDLKSNSNEEFSSIYLRFDTNSPFQVLGTGNLIPANTNLGSVNTITMIYTGGENLNIPLEISYTFRNNDTGTTHTNLYIREAKTKAQSSGGIELSSETKPEGKAGEIIKIPLTLTNKSGYEASDIIITPNFSSDDNPFIIDQLVMQKNIEKLDNRKSIDIEFQLKVDKYAKEKTYSFPIEIKYKNPYGVEYREEKLIYVGITNSNILPKLVVRDAVSSPAEIKEDETFTVTFDVWNMGTLEAENVTVDLKPNENFDVLENVTKKFLFEMKGLQSSKVTYTLKAKKKLKTGTYGVTVLLQHKDMQAPEEYTMYVVVAGSEEEEKESGDVNIVTENINSPLDSVLTEHPFTISMDIRNTGSEKAENVKVTLDSGDKILPQSLNVVNISEIAPGESVPVAFSFIASKDCESQSYPIKAVIDYKNGDEAVKKEQYIGVLVKSTKTTTLNTVPKIIISEYSFDPGIVNAGENFKLYMTFLNTSKLKAVQNMKITLIVNESSQETGSVFTPVQSSNTFYIDYLGPGETSKKEMVMYTIPDAKAKTYVVETVFEYEYEEQGQLKTNNMKDVFGIPVVQPAKLETSEVIVQEPAFVGEPVYITAEFYNMGKVTLSNLMLKVEGEFDAKEANYFVGNFEMGSSDYYEASIIPLQAGETKGKLVFTFEDAAGTSHRIEKEFTVNAMEAAPVGRPGFPGGDMGVFPGMEGMDPGMMGPKTKKFPVIPVAIGAAVVIAVVVLVIVLRKRKKRKEMMLDEDI